MSALSRRDLLRNFGLSAAALSLAPHAFARPTSANDKLTIACIGVGSQGLRVLLDLLRLPEVQIVAVCDCNRGSDDYIDWSGDELRKKVRAVLGNPTWGDKFKGPAAGRDVAQSIVNEFYAKARGTATANTCAAFEDFRDLLVKQHDLDAVAISTPDHWHALIAIAAMRAGKHVYSQKPMAHSVAETRRMAQVAHETRRATQVSIFNSDLPKSKAVHDLITSGIIGSVSTIDIWTRRPGGFWPQGIPTPSQVDPIPANLNWDLWLGPAPTRPFNRAYQPFIWRGWYDFGCGSLGDMGEYGIDTISRALNLGAPDRVDATTTERFPDSYPLASSVHLRFPAVGSRREIALNWLDSGLKPARPAGLPLDAPLSVEGEGVLYIGDHGKLLTGFMGESPRLLKPDGTLSSPLPSAPPEPEQPFALDRPDLGPSASSADAAHFREWIAACHGGPPARANYAFEQPIVEGLMLGCIAIRTGELLEWDAAAGHLTRGSARATALLDPPYRAPFTL